ncbi:MAG: hypothetical protein PHO75_02245 [Candidatus Shapirobacteria bacterium]|nr:hypothetical protein [Candidatus Shapirobacteria bacterium]
MDFEEKKLFDEKQEKITNLLLRVKKINQVYKVATEEQRGRLLESSKFIVDQLVDFGYERVFVETLLIGGKDFVNSFFSEERDLDVYGVAKLIFG